MALLWIDGFDDLATATGTDIKARLSRRYMPTGTSSPNYKSGSGRISGYSVTSDSGVPYLGLTSLTNTSNDTWIAGFAVYCRTQTTSNVTAFAFYDWAAAGINLRIEMITGEVNVWRGSTFLAGSSGANLTYGRWHYIEIKTKVHSTAGTVEVRVGGVPVISISGVNTQVGSHAYHNKCWFYLSNFNFDDFYLADTTGTVNNDFLGNVRVVTLFPNGDGGTNEWTTSSGTDHYALVDEGIENDDTDYIESSTSGQTDLWTYGDISGTGSIAGVQLATVCRDTNTPVFSIKSLAKSGATTSEDTAQVVGMADFGTLRRIVETDPNTSALWNPSGFNAAQFGVKVG